MKSVIEEIPPEERLSRYFAPLLIIRAVVGLIAGMVLMFWPKTGLGVIAVGLGIFLLFDGIERVVYSLRNRGTSATSDIVRIAGAVLKIAFAALILLNPVVWGGVWATIVFILAGINMVGTSMYSLWNTAGSGRESMEAGLSVPMLVIGLLMMIMPLLSALFLFRILGVVLILAAIPALAAGLRKKGI